MTAMQGHYFKSVFNNQDVAILIKWKTVSFHYSL